MVWGCRRFRNFDNRLLTGTDDCFSFSRRASSQEESSHRLVEKVVDSPPQSIVSFSTTQCHDSIPLIIPSKNSQGRDILSTVPETEVEALYHEVVLTNKEGNQIEHVVEKDHTGYE